MFELLAAFGCFWLLWAAFGCFWLLLAAFGCFWLLLAAFCCLLLLFVLLAAPLLLLWFSFAAPLLLACLACCSLAVPLLFPYCFFNFFNVERASRSLIRQVPGNRLGLAPQNHAKKRPQKAPLTDLSTAALFQLFFCSFWCSSGALLAALLALFC